MDSGAPFTHSSNPPPYGAGSDSHSQAEGLGTLVSGIVSDLQGIVRGEISLAKAELRDDATSIGQAIGSLIAGAIVLLVGFIFLMLGVTYLLNKSFEMWISAGIVGLVLLIIGAILASAGKKKMSAASLKPTKSIDSLKEDQQWASQQIKSVGK